MRVLSAADVRVAITMHDAIAAVRDGFIALSRGEAQVPVRSSLPIAGGVLLTMPAALGAIGSVKVVSVCGHNPALGLPAVNAAVLVVDAETGRAQALIEGRLLTALRTGAASGLATDLLARPEAEVLGVIGAGPQALAQVEAICAVRPIREIRVYSRSGAQAFAHAVGQLHHLEAWAASSASEALAGADIIVAATNSPTPVVRGDDVQPGAHVNGIGSFTPQMQEVAADLILKAKVIVDHRASAWEEAGDLIIPRDQGLFDETIVHAEIGEVAVGDRPGRESSDEITFFKSVGNAVQDAAVAARILAAAEALDLGVEIHW